MPFTVTDPRDPAFVGGPRSEPRPEDADGMFDVGADDPGAWGQDGDDADDYYSRVCG